MADVAEPADVEFGVEEPVEVQPEPGIDLVGVFAQGHVGQVQEPADLQVVGKLLEVLGEMPIASREPLGFVCTAAGEIGRMHELSPRHMMQFSFSPRRKAVTPWR